MLAFGKIDFIRATLWGVVVFALQSCNDFELCGNQVIREDLAPDKKFKVVTFQRDCGATTGFSTQASLIEANSSLLNKGGNIFAADTNHGKAPATVTGGPELVVSWKDSKHLVLQYHSQARVFLKAMESNGIEVTHEALQ